MRQDAEMTSQTPSGSTPSGASAGQPDEPSDAAGPATAFVPEAFVPPERLDHVLFRLEPLGPQHNVSDHEAWSSSIEHIRATPGFEASSWPRPMTRAENRADLERHARDFVARTGFTYTVLEPETDRVVGCLYIYPSREGDHDADVRSWVCADRAAPDAPLWQAVTAWLAAAWPFARPGYAAR